MKRVMVLSGLLVIGCAALIAQAQARKEMPTQRPEVGLVKVTDTLYVITGGGSTEGTAGSISGNTAVLITDKGVVLVDTKIAGWGQAVLAQVQSITKKPVTTIINTHQHFDHVGGNEAFPTSVEIIAHENAKANMEKMVEFQGYNKAFLPRRTFKNKLSLFSGKDQVDLYYFGRAHTDGDTIIVFPSARAAHFGDMFSRKGTPSASYGIEFADTLAKAAAGIKGVDVVIPGHADPTDWKTYLDYVEFYRTFLSAVRHAKQESKTVEQTVATLKMPDKFKDWWMDRKQALVEVIYRELK
jgi:glyoxylase-like metal-dependent hydrolase (beta-lactamase superfamily II)